MGLAGIVGHERQIEVLRRSLRRSAVAPASLFFGPPGVGKKKTAVEFGRALLCGEGDDACGRCPSCHLVGGGAHPDFRFVTPEARALKIEQVREVQAFLSLTPSRGARKVAVVDPAEALTIEAANAMLKTLEEPPSGSVIILVSSNPGALPATVLSRCRKVGFGTLTDGQVAEVLRREGWGESEAATAAALAEGSPSLALAAATEVRARSLAEVRKLLDAADSRDRGKGLGLVEAVGAGREETELALQLVLAMTRVEMRRRLGLTPAAASPPDPAVSSLDGEGLSGLAEGLLRTLRLLAGNVNVKLALGSLLMDWIDLLPAGPSSAPR